METAGRMERLENCVLIAFSQKRLVVKILIE